MRVLVPLLTLCALLACQTMHAAPEPPDWVPALLTQEEATEGFFPLFDGESLDGWWIRGTNPDAFTVEDGLLVVTGEPDGDWIFTDLTFDNYVLRYEYRLPPEGGNSGVSIRAPRHGDPAFAGMEIQVLTPGHEIGWQSSGAIYAAVEPEVEADRPVGEWNSVEVLVDGPRIRTIMNDQTLYDILTTDYDEPGTGEEEWRHTLADRPLSGHIAIQSHSDYVEFRNIRLKPLPGGPEWRPLFNQRDLTGWTVVGDAQWTVLDDGILRGDGAGMTERSELRSLEEFEDFEIQVWIRTHDRANSGVFFRGRGEDAWPRSYEAQIDNHATRYFTGAIWDQAEASELRAMDHCWFHMHVIAQGRHIDVRVNGKTVVEHVADETRHETYPSGWITLQAHDPDMIVDFDHVEVRPVQEENRR